LSRRAYLTPAAEADLADVWAYIALERRAPLSADRFVVRLRRQCDKLAQSPRIGRLRPELGPAIRVFPVDRYLILYRAKADGIDVVRVLSGSIDLPSQ
jgi:toxin ParE1/3/4